ncbi:MAG: recombinase family protein [Eubacteriales bacterium]
MVGVIYARYSSDNQREESIEGQMRECLAFAKKQGIQIADTFIDRALSAKTDNRPEFLRMIHESSKKLFDVVIVWKLDRFSRNRYDSASYKFQLKKHNVKVMSATEKISDGAEGILLESLLEGIAEYFSADLAEKVTRGMTENALKCLYNGGSVPIGLQINEKQQFEPDPLVAPLVVKVFQDYVAGESMQKLADMLSSKGVHGWKRKKVTINMVSTMLKNRKYIGEYKFQEIIVPDGIPAIITPELFSEAQEKMKKNQKGNRYVDDYVLTSKLFCGDCGRLMVGESGRSKTGRVYHYYKCVGTKKLKDCKKKAIRKDLIEDLVLGKVSEIIRNKDLLERISQKLFELQSGENTNIPLIEKQIKEVEKSVSNIHKAIEQGIFTASTKDRLDELEKQKLEIEVELAREKLQTALLSKEEIYQWLEKFWSCEITEKKQKRMLIDYFINSIYLEEEKVTIVLNYRDGQSPVPINKGNSSHIQFLGVPVWVLL